MESSTLRTLRIVRLRASRKTTFLFFELETGDGLIGTGEATMSGDDAAAARVGQRLFDEILRGQPLSAAPRLRSRLESALGAEPSLVDATALSALDQCLWDLRGQSLGLPLFELVGGSHRESIKLYANVNRGTVDRSVEGFAVAAKTAIDAGFTAIKCAPFDNVRPGFGPDDEAVRLGMARLAAIRSAIPAETRLMVDCHGRFGVETMQQLLPEFQSLGLFWLEEPFMTHPAMNSVISLADGTEEASYPLAEAALSMLSTCGIKLSGGEFDYGVGRFDEILQTTPLSFVMPDIKHCGGFSTLTVIAGMAAARGVAVAPHNPSGPIATVGSMHVCAALPNFEMLEYQWNEVPERESYITPYEPRAGGDLELSSRPGLGFSLNYDVVQELEVSLEWSGE